MLEKRRTSSLSTAGLITRVTLLPCKELVEILFLRGLLMEEIHIKMLPGRFLLV